MIIIVKPKFRRDVDRISHAELLIALEVKVNQIKRSKSADGITGLKLLRGYTHHYRIIVRTSKYSYRIGAIVRGQKIWLARFLPRKIVYREFP